MKSSFDGYIKEIPFILVDNFENKHKSAYFLSHYHGDHIFGINTKDFPEKLKKNNGFIYGSEVTVAIIKNDVPELSPYLKVLDLGRNSITIIEDNEELYLNVTALPAGHSLGSLMFLFEYKQTVLYTGDFRITPNTLSKFTHLHRNGEPIHLDALYVDTTFQDVPSYPRRSEVVRNIVPHIQNWLDLDKRNRIVILTSAMYGYEYVCNKLYEVLKIKTYIGGVKWNVFSQFPKDMCGITNDPSSRIHLCKTNENIYAETPEILFIHFSAMKWRDNATDENFIKIKKNKIEACFATHNGRDELLYFKNYFQPKRIVGFPNPFCSSTPVKFENNLNKEPLHLNFSRNSKRLRSNSESEDCRVGKKISKDAVRSMFEW